MNDARTDRCPPGCCEAPDRREVLRLGLGGAVALLTGRFAVAGPFKPEDFDKLIPADKKLSEEWVKSLFARGEPAVYSGADLDWIGMPVGGVCAGQLYLGGDGKLWHWDVFNLTRGTGDSNYAHPVKPASPLSQGFALRVTADGKTSRRPLDRAGFADVRFRGEYPVGKVEYRDDAVPVAVTLEAFSPFIPLNADDSGLPATVLQFTVKNTGRDAAEVELAGWLENAVCLETGKTRPGVRRNRVLRQPWGTLLACSAEAPPPGPPEKPPTVFADFEGKDYGDWKVEGEAFGKGPSHGANQPVQEGRIAGWRGKGLVNSYAAEGGDAPHGKLTSPEFTVERPFISFLIGGGNHPGETCVNLVSDGKVVRTATGKDDERLTWTSWDVRDLKGKKARIEIVDNHSGGWGHINCDQIEFGDSPHEDDTPLEGRADFGTMALALLDPKDGDHAAAALPEGEIPAGVFADEEAAGDEARKPFGQRLRGVVGRTLKLDAGKEATVTFVLAWNFPNLQLDFPTVVGRHYASRFSDAKAVAEYFAKNFERLAGQTRLWVKTWYDSTLPYWLLDRTAANASILATSTAHRFKSGRFYGWEGVGCCAGTCTHVWHYAHAAARLFPALERLAREEQDFGDGFDPKTGLIDHRGKHPPVGYAADGQAGCILRAYREHQTSADDAFLKRVWPKVKKALEYMIEQDGDDDGVIENYQHNTLDTGFWGASSWLSSLYVAALRAGEEMARELKDDDFAARCKKIAASGGKKIADDLFNGEYFYHKADPKHPEAMRSGDGCEIDQVFGQSWAFQVGLGRLLDADKTRTALKSLWKYNWTPDVGPYRGMFNPGRWYAMPGEGGLIMCTWPKGGHEGSGGKADPVFAAYFNECMNGFEYQAAGHMVWEGLVQEGLAVARSVHDRYHPSRRNPYNEVECGDHYARSMASYGVFLAACGFEHHGPKGRVGFAPRLTPDDFRAPFTAAEGWGTFSQQRGDGGLTAKIEVHWGKLRVKTLALEAAEKAKPTKAEATVGGKAVEAALTADGRRVLVTLAAPAKVGEGEALEVTVR
jgi:uncharacterized protein (DUF608 family)